MPYAKVFAQRQKKPPNTHTHNLTNHQLSDWTALMVHGHSSFLRSIRKSHGSAFRIVCHYYIYEARQKTAKQ